MKIVTFAIALGTLAATATATAAGAASAPPAEPFKGQELAGQAQVSLAQARRIASLTRPGAIIDQELEKEASGSGLRYAFDVKSRGETYEVGVDAHSGRVIENAVETAAQEAKEALLNDTAGR